MTRRSIDLRRPTSRELLVGRRQARFETAGRAGKNSVTSTPLRSLVPTSSRPPWRSAVRRAEVGTGAGRSSWPRCSGAESAERDWPSPPSSTARYRSLGGTRHAGFTSTAGNDTTAATQTIIIFPGRNRRPLVGHNLAVTHADQSRCKRTDRGIVSDQDQGEAIDVELNVLRCAQHRNEIERLEHETHRLGPITGTVSIAHLMEILPIELHRAPGDVIQP